MLLAGPHIGSLVGISKVNDSSLIFDSLLEVVHETLPFIVAQLPLLLLLLALFQHINPNFNQSKRGRHIGHVNEVLHHFHRNRFPEQVVLSPIVELSLASVAMALTSLKVSFAAVQVDISQ